MRHRASARVSSLVTVIAVSAGLLVANWAPYAAAGVGFTVTKTADTADGSCDADCSLREAVIAANAAPGTDQINVPAGTYGLTLTGAGENAAATGDLDVSEGVTILGSGTQATVIDASGDRAFEFHSGDSELAALHVRDGAAAVQGAVFNRAELVMNEVLIADNLGGGITNAAGATLELIDSTVAANFAGAQTEGAGLRNFADALVLRSTFTDNYASGGAEGGAINHDTPGVLSVVNSTFSNNRSGSHGGAIAVRPGAIAEILNSTIVFNEAGVDFATGEGGGILSRDSSTTSLANSIIALNTAADAEPNCSEDGYVELGWVLDNDGDCVSRFHPPSPTHVTAADPGVDPVLAPNGGPTETHALEPDSPAVDAGNPAAPDATPETCEADDQRGFARPVGACDIGAFELFADDETGPTINLVTPPEGAVYARNQVVNADYSCEDELGGSGLASCDGDVPNGSPIDTASLGAKTFTIDATDNVGNPSSVTHNYTVVHAQPDGHIRRSTESTFVGDNRYNIWAIGQRRRTSIPPGGTAGFRVLVQNDGAVVDDITVTGDGSSGAFTVRYFVGFFDITSLVTGAGFTFEDLAPGASQQMIVQIKASGSATPGSIGAAHVILTSAFGPPIWDAVRAEARVT